jgi:hypothetical protein
MFISEALASVQVVSLPDGGSPVLRTVAKEIASICGGRVVTRGKASEGELCRGVFQIHADPETLPQGRIQCTDTSNELRGVFCELAEDGTGHLAATHTRFLFSFCTYLLRDLAYEDVGVVANGKFFKSTFSWNRPTYDFFLTQEGRIQRNLNRDTYVRRLAESGFTHLEINGLAFPEGHESGPAGEVYPMFYTYCPALDQFVASKLNSGLYSPERLSENLGYLKKNAQLAREYGLVPGLLCFEPRSVPEEFFDRYPMLRGARVDHPFRSFKPRYNMTIAHPLVREHYAEMVQRLMEAVPELGFLSVWTNDSGAGFEHTQSLYVGRNGGAYLIREWKNETQIADAAAENALRFLSTLRDAARATNPEFRVCTRLESFYGEHDQIWAGLRDGLDAEATSLVSRGWEMPYAHAAYPDSKSFVSGTVHQQTFETKETELAAELADRSSYAHFYFAAGPNTLFAPLIGIPYPKLTFRRLQLLHSNGVDNLAHVGGTNPPEQVPFNVNHEVLRAFQFDPELDADKTIQRIARRWVGALFAGDLQRAWAECEKAILAFPHVTPLYSTYGFVWYRLWARPLVPNIEAIPEEERAYYQEFMCTTPHNPNNIDLSRDVLFQLTTVDDCRKALNRIDDNIWKPLDAAIAILENIRESASGALGDNNAIADTLVRLKALCCWFRTQRSVAAWVVGVCGYLETSDETERSACKTILDQMIVQEIENSERLMELLDLDVDFMATTDLTETPLMHGRNMKELLEHRISLMQAHRGDEPFFDPHYMERMASEERGGPQR